MIDLLRKLFIAGEKGRSSSRMVACFTAGRIAAADADSRLVVANLHLLFGRSGWCKWSRFNEFLAEKKFRQSP
jgi:hypothetical protein